jgi:hypothetical protein
MAANSAPRLVLPVNSIGRAVISTANTARDGTGGMGTVLTAGPEGTLVELVRVIATGTTTAGMVRLFLHDGTAARLWDELAVTAVTPSGTVAAFEGEITPSKPLVLPSGWSLRASTHNAEEFVVHASGGNY